MTQIIESQQSIWYIIPLLPISLLFLIAIIAETNRAPMDLRSSRANALEFFSFICKNTRFFLNL